MYVVVNQKTMALIGPFEEPDIAWEWIDRVQAANDFDGYCTTYEVHCLCSANIA